VVVVVGPVRQVPRPVIFTSEDPPGGQAASTLLGRLEDEPSTAAAVGIDVYGREQPLQLALRPAAARALLAGAGPGGAAGVSARRLLDALRPGLMSQGLAPAELWDIDSPDQLIAWRLLLISGFIDLGAGNRTPARSRATGCHCH
jgi:molybdenum cofactor guanylyltransferase